MTTISNNSLIRSPFFFPVALAFTCVVIWFFGDKLTDSLQYDREAIAHGEIWRLFSAHLTHLTGSHLLLNLGGLALTWILFGRLLTSAQWFSLFLFAGLLVSAGVWWFDTDIRWYVGLSGVLHGFFIAGGLADFFVRRTEGILFLITVAGKVIWEQLFGPLPGSEESAGGPVLVDAHFYGAIAGLLWYLLFWGWKNAKR